jgi:hypothetical protein
VKEPGAREGYGRVEAWGLAALMLLLPFEPRRHALELAGFKVTLLELVAAVAVAGVAWATRRGMLALARRPPLPLLFVAAYAGAQVLSAVLAAERPDAALKFSLRMVAMAGFAWVVASASPRARRRGLLTLCASACVVAVLAVAEGLGLPSLDGFLGVFREMPFNVAGSRRASAGSEYPNLAAAFVMYGLLAGVALAGPWRRPELLVAAGALLASLGLLFTYSRGALVASALGLVCLAAALAWRRRSVARLPLLALGVLALSSTAFAWRGEIFRLRLASEGTGAWYAAAYESAAASLRLAPGEDRTVAVHVTNTGRKTWAVEESFHLSYHWYDVERRLVMDGPRTVLPRDVRSGDSVVLDALVRAPVQEGRYLLVWDMVHERTTWFSGQGVEPATVTVDVGGAAPGGKPLAAPPRASLAWRPSRAELWRLALELWRERPLTGAGPDNFRWLHGPRAGQVFWDSRVYANNTLLEAAATTGSLGLLTLGGCLVSSLARALSRTLACDPRSAAGAEAAALLALLAGIAAHGAVDYVLAFTGHYLMFGFVVGGVSSPLETAR